MPFDSLTTLAHDPSKCFPETLQATYQHRLGVIGSILFLCSLEHIPSLCFSKSTLDRVQTWSPEFVRTSVNSLHLNMDEAPASTEFLFSGGARCTVWRLERGHIRYVLCKHYVTGDFPFYLPQVNYYSAVRKPPALLDGRKEGGGREEGNRENGSSFCPLPFLLSSSLA